LNTLYFNLGILDSARNFANRARDVSDSYKQIGVLFIYYLGLKEWDQAFEFVNRGWATDTKSLNYFKGIISLYKRDYDIATDYYLKSDYRSLDWGLILLKEGLKDSAASVFERTINQRISLKENISPQGLMDISRAHAAMGNMEEFMKYARLAFELGWHNKSFFEQDPFFDEIRGTPEFKLIEKEFYEKNEQLRKEVLEVDSKPLESRQ